MKRAMVVLTLLVMTTSAYAGTHVFNFDDAGQLSGNWFIRDEKIWPQDPENVDWSVENGELVAISSDVCAGLSGNWILDDTYMDWRNCEISCRFKIVQTLIPACNIYSNFLFAIHVYGGSGRALMLSLETRGSGGPWDKVTLGKSDFSWQGQPALRPPLEEGRWYTLQMVAKDNQYQIFLDDQLIIETKSANPNFARGSVGFGIKNAEIHFDDFTITGEDIPETLSPASQDLITRMGLKPMIPESEMQQSEKLAAVSPKAKLATTWGQMKVR